MCGQFDSDTEIASFSKEVEEVFQVTEIINHPDYQPHKVTRRQVMGPYFLQIIFKHFDEFKLKINQLVTGDDLQLQSLVIIFSFRVWMK